jgi:DNA-binding response OmpR family regulator
MASRALIVDDSRTARVRIRKLLETVDAGEFEVDEAVDGAEALKLLEKTPLDRLPDVVLLDRNMPIVSGDACVRILKSDPVWKTIPVIFLTAQADKAEVAKGLTCLGADDYLPKPFDAGEMLARVKALVRAKKAEDQSRALTHNLELALEAQRKAYRELKTTKIELAETQAVAMMTRAFEKFVPKQFLQRIARDALENLKPGNVQASQITTLFTDLRSFSTISEGMTPQSLFAFLNEYLAWMQEPIDHFGGFIDKFIGDAIMALFDQNGSAQAEAAVKAAIGMQRRLLEWNHERVTGLAGRIRHRHPHRHRNAGNPRQHHPYGLDGDRRSGQPRLAARRTDQALRGPDHCQRRHMGIARPVRVRVARTGSGVGERTRCARNYSRNLPGPGRPGAGSRAPAGRTIRPRSGLVSPPAVGGCYLGVPRLPGTGSE